MAAPNIELLNCDCMEYMATLGDNAFELAICDPPYGIGNFNPTTSSSKGVYVGKHKAYTWNNKAPDVKYFNELVRVSKERIIWGSNYYQWVDGKGGSIVWDKVVMHPDMSRCEIASYSRLQQVVYYRHEWAAMDKYNKLKGTDIHPCQKPVELYDWLLSKYAKEGDRILDTHLGSGSSAIAAHYGGFDFVGCELDKDYYEAACERFKQATAQQALI